MEIPSTAARPLNNPDFAPGGGENSTRVAEVAAARRNPSKIDGLPLARDLRRERVMESPSTVARPLNNPDFAPSGGENSTSAAEAAADGAQFWGEDGFTFADLLDIINPLQHLPIIGSIYRALTGDEISPAARIAGGALFGGPLGLIGAVANQAIEETTGKDLGDHAIALFTDDAAGAEKTMLANAAPTAEPIASPPSPPPAGVPLIMAARPREAPPPPAITQARRASIATTAPAARGAGAVPSLSPGAFDALMREFGSRPATGPASPTARVDELPLPRGAGGEDRRRAALELHQLLAERHGERPTP